MHVYIIHGSPLSGKTTYVESVMGDNDMVFDYDKIMSALTLKPEHDHNDNVMNYIMDFRSIMISRLKSEERFDNVYIIITNISEEFKQSLIGLNPIYKEMIISIDEARSRLANDPDNRDRDVWAEVLNKYYSKQEIIDEFHWSQAWKSKREYIRRRDEQSCKQCLRYGKRVDGTTVHHILPLEVRPDLRLDDKNLITLCKTCHESMHNKFNGTLSKLGEEVKTRTMRKYPELENMYYDL